jgi:predicted small lipoprotein YifL
MKKTFALPLLTALALTISACGGRAPKALPPATSFPYPEPPAMVTDPTQRASYAVLHFWDKYFEAPSRYSEGLTEQAFANYVTLLQLAPLASAARAQDTLLSRAERSEAARDTASRMLERILMLEEKYLYDVNSPFRNEEFYLPVLRHILAWPDIQPETRARAQHDLPLFSLNRLGEVAADFTYTLRNGRTGTLHSIQADRILMFFSNPGRENCKEIIEALSNSMAVQAQLQDGTLKVLNVYPDEDLSEWFAYMSHYPKSWINAFDAECIIRGDTIYSLRAIPSLYLLDSEKRVICKDAPLEEILRRLEE